MKPYSLDLHK
jgi:hypothetical protein